ncbi:ComEC/Rec2 family competence protein [uncultured Aquimarina sp.]|uniref:ComEC/Rec2 family competence protein n=1 Tax=uncultured Aquimarina sp. TaxID=575652 RepID=UPI0026114B06|nr:ComEC/Rec2 family competence protein [uncultured Aquimarina sp.]
MHKLLNIPFLILTFSLIVGIVIGYYISIDLKIVLIAQGIAISGLISTWWYAKKMFRSAIGFSALTLIVFILLGITLVQIHHPKNNPDHYTNLFSEEYQENSVTISFYIKERLKPTSFYEKYVITLQSIESQKTTGNLLLQIPKADLQTNLTIGASYITHSQIKLIPSPSNPNQFNYAHHLSQQYIFHKVTTDLHQLIPRDIPMFSIHYIASYIRTDINQKLALYDFNKKQLSIINALLLGQRQDIDQETFTDYRDAGAIHILAVSGLHVGILLMLLNFILKPLERLISNGKAFKTIFIIIVLWCFAVIASLSPSILRAVTMFSFIAIGMHIRSKTSIYNALIVSMFMLLCMRPLLLFSVGFQLSYLAVFAIVWIQPLLVKLYRPRFYIDKILWETFTVTISAQLGLLPLTLFYFHQFPLLFFIANLIIIPLLGFLLGFGILVMTLAEIGILPDWMAATFGGCIDVMNSIVHWVSKQETYLITDITFSWRMLIIGYTLIISLVFTFKKFKLNRIFAVTTSVAFLLFIFIYEKKLHLNKEELVIFHNHRNTTLSVLHHQNVRVYSKDSISEITKSYLFKGYLTQNNSKITFHKKLKNIYNYREKTILVIDSSAIYNIKELHPDIIILSNSPKIHLNRVIEILEPKQIIADGSNYRSYLDKWEKSCKKQKIPFHRTDKKGAYILNTNSTKHH